MASAALHLLTLGDLRVIGDADAVVSTGGKHLVLLTFLVRHAPRPVEREELATLLWGEKDETRARQSLRQAVLRLKRDLGEALLVSGSSVGVARGAIDVDAGAFETDVAAGRFEDAVARWKGEFLAGCDAAGGEAFRTWLEAERAALLRRLHWAFGRLVDERTAEGSARDAIRFAERWVELFPIDEGAHARLIRLLHADGRPADALARHAAFSLRFAEILGADPSVEFRRLAEDLRRTADRTAEASASAALRPPELVGRTAQLAALRSIWARVAEESAVVLVEGEEGIGKTRFCREFIQWLEQRPGTAVVLEAAALPSDANVPLSVAKRLFSAIRTAPGISAASDRALGEVSALVPSLRERFANLPAASGRAGAAGLALHEVLGEVAAETSIVILVDDVPFADDASRDLILELVRRPPPAALLIVTARTDALARTSGLNRCGELPAVRRLKLQPLALHEVGALLASMFELARDDNERLAAYASSQAGGNPFCVTELVSGLADEGALTVGGTGRWSVAQDLADSDRPTPRRVREAIGAQLSTLDPRSRTVLEAASVIGEGIDPALLEAMAGLPPADLSAGMEELVGRRLLLPAGSAEGRYTFAQPVAGRVAYELLQPARRQALHAAALGALERGDTTGADVRSRRDHHRVRAGELARRGWRRIGVGVRIAALVALITVTGLAVTALRRSDGLPAPSEQRLVVVAFKNETGRQELDALGRIAADWLSQGIAKTSLVKVAPPLLGEPATAQPKRSDGGAHWRGFAANADADIVVWGSYYLDHDSLRFQARVTDARAGRVLLAPEPAAAALSQPMAAVEQLRARTLAALAPWLDPRLTETAGLQSAPPSYEAYLAFAEGLNHANQRHGALALPHFRRAYALDTTWTLPLLAEATIHAGEVRPAQVESVTNILLPRRAELAPYDRILLDILVAQVRGDLPARFAVGRAAFEMAPGIGALPLAEAAMGLNLPREAVEVLSSIDPDRGQLGKSPAYWDRYAHAAHMAGDYERQLWVGKETRRRLPNEVRGIFYQARALAALGRFRELDVVLAEGMRLPSIPGWGPPGMRMHVVISDELRAHGYPEMAAEVLERAVRFYEAAPEEIRAVPKHRLDMAQALHRLGRLAEARRILEALIALDVVMPATPVELRAHLAFVAAAAGDLDTVEEIDRWLRDLRQPYMFGSNTEYRAGIRAVLGDREEAVRLLQQAMAEGRAYDAGKHHYFEYSGLRGYPPFEEWLRPKG